MDETESYKRLASGRQRPGGSSRIREWLARLGGRTAPLALPVDASAGAFDVHAALHLLPSLLEAQGLPNGVVELVIEDAHAPGRCLLDVHDGQVSHVEPGTMVPWVSIAGSHRAWKVALDGGETAGLRPLGEERLAERVLAALARPATARPALVEQATA